MVTATHPWRSVDNPYTACYSIAQSQDLPYVPTDISKEMRDFIFLCLQRKKEMRPSCDQLWKTLWLGMTSPAEPGRKATVNRVLSALLESKTMKNNKPKPRRVKSAKPATTKPARPVTSKPNARHASGAAAK